MIYNLAIWGRAFTKTYLDLVLPSHLAKGNVDCMNPEDEYRIFTNRETARSLKKSKDLQRLASMVRLSFEITPKKNLSWDEMTRFHKRMLVRATQSSQGCVFLGPDFIVSPGCFERIQALHAQGKSLILVPGIRTDLQAIRRKIKRHTRQGRLEISREQLARYANDSLHTITRSLFVDSKRFTRWPSAIIKEFPTKDGLLIQSFHIHPIYAESKPWVDVEKFESIDGMFLNGYMKNKREVHFVRSSSEMLLVEMSDPEKRIAEGAEPYRFSKRKLYKFLAAQTNEFHRWAFKHPYALLTKSSERMPEVPYILRICSIRLGLAQSAHWLKTKVKNLHKKLETSIQKEQSRVKGRLGRLLFYILILKKMKVIKSAKIQKHKTIESIEAKGRICFFVKSQKMYIPSLHNLAYFKNMDEYFKHYEAKILFRSAGHPANLKKTFQWAETYLRKVKKIKKSSFVFLRFSCLSLLNPGFLRTVYHYAPWLFFDEVIFTFAKSMDFPKIRLKDWLSIFPSKHLYALKLIRVSRKANQRLA